MDMLLDIGTEEIAPVEILAWMIGRLLEKAPVKAQDEAAAASPVVEAALGGSNVRGVVFAAMNPQHEIVSGQGATAKDSIGVHWSGAASGNLLADFRFDLLAEWRGNLQVGRLYEMTPDTGVRKMLSFNLARDIMHQNQWQPAIDELRADGIDDFIVPGTLPLDRVMMSQAHAFWNLSQGSESQQGRWAQGPTPDGKGEFEYVADPAPLTTDTGDLPPADPRLHGTARQPMPPVSSGGPDPNPDQSGS